MLAPPAIAALVAVLAHDTFGSRILANALASIDAGLVEGALVRDLLADVQEQRDADPDLRWAEALWCACHGKCHGLRRSGGYLRSAPAPSGSKVVATTWTTVVPVEVWLDKHLDKTKKRTIPLPAFPPTDDFQCRSQFAAVVAEPDWFQRPTPTAGAWLGRPAIVGANCWISSTDLDAGFVVSDRNTGEHARRAIEALGIRVRSPLDCFVRYTIDAAKTGVQSESRRPSFCDLGNEWFRVAPGSDRARHYASEGWGCTVNLAAVRAKLVDDTGRPERVTTSLSVDVVAVCDVAVLLPRGSDVRFTMIDDSTFDASLKQGRSSTELETAVLALWGPLPPATP